MLNKHYQVYIDNVFTLARSLLLKSDYTAQRINDLLYIKYGDGTFDPHDRATWKYYLNLSGEYHSTDQPIYVNSFDTHSEIIFNKLNFETHLDTKYQYRVGTQFHKELLALHPQQEALIRGVLNPIDINYAIDCEEFTILDYARDYVEENEYSLMENLQNFITSHSSRYHNKQFTISDDIYYATYLSLLMMNTVMAIMSHRLKTCKSSEAHSFHVMQYLSSCSKIGEHYKYLSHEQRMFFMRNIKYIERRVGMKENFDWLRTNLMDAINMPLASFEVRHDLSGMPDNIKPQVMFRKLPINTKRNLDAIDEYTLTNVMDLTDDLSPMNASIRPTEELDFERRAGHAISNRTSVKLLESTAISNDGGERYTLDEITIQHWAHLAYLNVYRAPIPIRIPSSGKLIELDAKNAFILFIYSYSKSIRKDLHRVPRIITSRVIRYEKPEFDELRELANPDIVSDLEINNLLSDLPYTVPEIYSVVNFKSYCEKLFKMANKHVKQSELKAGIKTHVQYYNTMSRLWCDNNINDLYVGTYEEWFTDNGVDVGWFTVEDLNVLWKIIYKEASGMGEDSKSALENIQSSMTRLFMQMSSYSIRLVGNVKNSAAYKVGPSSIRFGNPVIATKNRNVLNPLAIKVSNFRVYQTCHSFDNLNAGGGIKAWLNEVKEQSELPKLLLDQKPSNLMINIESLHKHKLISDTLHKVTITTDPATIVPADDGELI